jgi:hypothetical protein
MAMFRVPRNKIHTPSLLFDVSQIQEWGHAIRSVALKQATQGRVDTHTVRSCVFKFPHQCLAPVSVGELHYDSLLDCVSRSSDEPRE